MVKEIVDLLKSGDMYGVSPYIDIAKGKYKAPGNFEEFKELINRRSNGR